ncbi:CARDB domain-containing protein [Halorubrum sp. HHNYT27]|uniref:CARDB domain-containing protein n=1 Tax=Halorubrum sp. HHNYT27 TaxID=3402275 RepID=UPI003EBAE4D5
MINAHRPLVFALLLVAAGSLLFATGAAVVDGPADIVDEDLAIQPTDGPNGKYAYLNDDDEIAIDVSASNPNIKDPSFEGVNVGSTGTIDGVFTITYTGERYAHVWIGYPNESVTFVADGESIESEANNVTLASNESVTVGLALDTRNAAAGTRLGADQFSIEANISDPDDVRTMGDENGQTGGGPTVTVTSPSADRRAFVGSGIGQGDTLRFRADGMHLAGADVTLERIDLESVRNERVELDATGSSTPFESASALQAPTTPRSMAYLALDYDFAPDAVGQMTIRFSADWDHLNATGTDPADVTFYRQTDAGDWEEKPVEVIDPEVVRLMDLPEDSVHFRVTTEEFSTFAVATRAPRFDVTEATVAPETIDPGEAATVRTTLRNGGSEPSERVVTLTADGQPVANETVALAPNETATIEFEESFGTEGAYELAVDGSPVGILIVGDPAGDGGSGSAEAGGSADTGEADPGPTEEPGGVDFVKFGGLLAALLIVVAGLALFRRIPRP